MPNLSPDNQTEAKASCEDVFGGIHATQMHSTSTKQNRREQDDKNIIDEISDACNQKRPSDENARPLAGAELKGRSLWTSFLTAALLLLLMCRLLYSILAATLSLLHQNNKQQATDSPLNQFISMDTIDINLQDATGTSDSDETHSYLPDANAKLSLEDALTAAQDAFDQFLASQRDVDLDGCIESWKNVLAICPIDHEICPSVLKNLGKSLRDRFDRSTDMSDLEESIGHQQTALSLWPMDHPIRPSSLSILGNALRTRFNWLSDMADLDESIRHYREALSLRPNDHVDRPDCLHNLSGVLGLRFDKRGDKDDLEESILLCQEALSLLTIGTAPTAEAKPKESPAGEVSSEPITGTAARGQQRTADVNTTGKQRCSGVNTNDATNPDSGVSDRLKAQWIARKASQDAAERFAVSKRDEDLDAWIKSLRYTVTVLPKDDPHFLDALRILGMAFDMRFDRKGDMVDFEECVRHQEGFLSICPTDHPDHAITRFNLGTILQTRFKRTENMADLQNSIRHLQEGLTSCPISHPHRSSILTNLSVGLSEQFERTGNMANLEESIRHEQEALSLSPIGHPHRVLSFHNLGIKLHTRFKRTGHIPDLEESIHHNREALALRPIGHPDRASTLNGLSIMLNMRFDRTGDVASLDESIRHLQEALTLCPIGHSYRASILNNLGIGLDRRFEGTGNMADLEGSICHLQEALTLCPIGHPDRASILSNIGIRLDTRFGRTRDIADLEKSICHLQEALALRLIGHTDRALTLNHLGHTLNTRFARTGNMSDLEESIRHHREALTLCPIGHLDRAMTLSDLGNRLDTRFGRMRIMADLEESIRHYQEALTLRPIGHSDRGFILTNLGVVLNTRFGWTGNMADLKESIRHHKEALTLCPISHPDRAWILNNLGNRLYIRFGRTGDVADLEESIRHYQEALTLRPVGHPDRTSSLNNLGNTLNIRFGQRGNVADLDDSICYYQKALILCPIGHPDRPLTLNNLGVGLDTRFRRKRNIADLEESIHHHQEALALWPIDHPDRASTLSNLGARLNARFERMGNMADLEESIHHLKKALTLCPIGHSDRAATLSNLGGGLSTRFEWTGDVADLEESIRHHQEGLILCPAGHPDRAAMLNNLGVGLRTRFRRSGNMTDLAESTEHFTTAADQTLSKLSDRLAGAFNWIQSARRYRLESLTEAYSTYMDLLDRSLLLPSSSIPDTHAHMVHIRGDMVSVTEDATSHALKKNRLIEAVEIAERGRALLFTQLGNYRTPLNDLEVVNKDLTDRFRALSTALDHCATSLQDTIATLPDQVARRQQMAADWDCTVKEIRQLDGFKDFLGITPFDNLQKAAASGPVIIVNISSDGSDALVITASGDPLCVPLPEATPSAIAALANTLIGCTRSHTDEPKDDKTLIEVLRELWAMVVAPIVLQLETTLGLPVGSRIWWMPTAFAWWLPLHAAGPYKSGERNLPDRFISSYTTTLSSLIRARAGYQPIKHMSGSWVLVIAQAEAEGQVLLPSVGAEVALIRQLPTEVTVIQGSNCTRDTVLMGIKDMAWVHFSCHGHQDPNDPFMSHFSLRTADAPLTLLDIIQNDLPRAELAVLSACHSASGDLSTPNEAVNLAAGIMFAGFRGAVGTMWAMADEDGPVMAEHFYKYMFRNGPEAVDCRDAAKAMVMGVRELRRREVPLARWINFVHYGI